jgi:hypothetical protein
MNDIEEPAEEIPNVDKVCKAFEAILTFGADWSKITTRHGHDGDTRVPVPVARLSSTEWDALQEMFRCLEKAPSPLKLPTVRGDARPFNITDLESSWKGAWESLRVELNKAADLLR